MTENKNTSLQAFYRRAQSVSSLSLEEIKKFLKERFGDKYNPARESAYIAALVADETAREERKRRQQNKIIGVNISCPICNGFIIRDPDLDGPYTKNLGWKCTNGGMVHYFQWRINENHKCRGLEPIFPEVERTEDKLYPEFRHS